MKDSRRILFKLGILSLAAFLCLSNNVSAHATDAKKPLVIKVVNFKGCVEQSKMGKEEQASFEALKKQMETILEEKEKTLTEIADKFNDPDYLDSLSAEAETELKRKFRALSQELKQQEAQYYQALSQTNMKVVQKLTDAVAKASSTVAKNNHYDLVLNEDSFYYSPDLDVSSQVVAVMDEMYEKEAKEAKENKPGQPAIH